MVIKEATYDRDFCVRGRFVAMKIGMETLRGLRYKLRMMGIPLSDPSLIYGNNMSVIHNTKRLNSTFHKKSN